MSDMWRWLFLLAVIVSSFGGVRMVEAQVTLNNIRQTYVDKMNAYTKEKGQFDRDKTLYYRNTDEQHFATALSSAQKTFKARQEVMISYDDYLVALLDVYVGEQSPVTTTLKAQLAEKTRSFRGVSSSFTETASWYQADDSFARIMAESNETLYQAFAQIYYYELKAIYEEYKALYQRQNQRILSEAAGEVEREQKNNLLEQTARSLTTLQDHITSFEPKLSAVNSQDSYLTVRNQLNEIMAQLETSLKLYADLE